MKNKFHLYWFFDFCLKAGKFLEWYKTLRTTWKDVLKMPNRKLRLNYQASKINTLPMSIHCILYARHFILLASLSFTHILNIILLCKCFHGGLLMSWNKKLCVPYVLSWQTQQGLLLFLLRTLFNRNSLSSSFSRFQWDVTQCTALFTIIIYYYLLHFMYFTA